MLQTIISSNVGWGDIPIGAFFTAVVNGYRIGKTYRKMDRESAIDTEDATTPPVSVCFDPSSQGYNVIRVNIGTAFSEARELTAHRVNGLNEALRIFVLDGAGHGGASHRYAILVPYDRYDVVTWADEISGWLKWRILGCPDDVLIHIDPPTVRACIQRTGANRGKPTVSLEFFTAACMEFQNGPIKENGINGISQEALLAILIDRLEGFQSGPFKCRDNAIALTKIEEARLWLHKRTMDRVARGVEGTTTK